MKTSSRRNLLVAVTMTFVMITTAVIFISEQSRSAVAQNTATNKTASMPGIRFTGDGRLLRPSGYRRWTYVGTPLTPNDMNSGNAPFPEFHSVYINPPSYDQYGKTGEFPDGTVLIKELVSVGSKEATSGNGYFMGEFTGLEVLIKDKTRFKDEPGNWAFFSFGHEYPLKDAATIQPTANCNDCHGGAADDDYVFTQYYPVLREAKGKAAAE
ncbi:cytochrome P460 family protein [Stieleria sp. ICT_E10.1]|uniref:cytochrome P460 family protein n=1 Tax=Stieleria sedimenti TaxID=2976331 RepID=UPI00217F2546|nr:cytochrome P460 family protein [Stieleria sedimenti]MCS7468616.1 cytochrome P460 family protein [Stieleria sedimenti]